MSFIQTLRDECAVSSFLGLSFLSSSAFDFSFLSSLPDSRGRQQRGADSRYRFLFCIIIKIMLGGLRMKSVRADEYNCRQLYSSALCSCMGEGLICFSSDAALSLRRAFLEIYMYVEGVTQRYLYRYHCVCRMDVCISL